MDKRLYMSYANDKIKYISDHSIAFDYRRGKMLKMDVNKWKTKALMSNRILIKKIRQVGISELVAAEIAYNLNFKPNYSMLYVAPNTSMSKYQFDKVVCQFSAIPDNLRVGLSAEKRKDYYCTEINSDVRFASPYPGLGHSHPYDVIYMEEVDFMKKFEETYHSLVPCLSQSKDSKILISTTVSGDPSYFKNLWSNSSYSKLEITIQELMQKNIRKHSLNDITKTKYSKIIRSCVIS